MLKPAVVPPETSHPATTSNIHQENSTSHTSTIQAESSQTKPGHEEALAQFNIPSMSINAEKISSAMAARLATSLLCHVLFLKGQIPFPVVQLARIPGGKSNPRAGKKREELMNAVDTLSSHLQTTFTALSTAYALRQERANTSDCREDAPRPPATYMAFVLGPSVGAAKARVMLALDGLEAKAWATRVDDAGSVSDAGESDSDSETSSTNSSEDEQDGDTGDETACPPPPSRSPSPASRPSSPLTSVLNTPPQPPPFRIAASPPTDRSPPKLAKSAFKNLSENATPSAPPPPPPFRIAASPPTDRAPPQLAKPAFTILSENTPLSAPPRRRPLSAVLGPATQKASPRPLAPAARTHGENAPPRLRAAQSISAPLARLSLSPSTPPTLAASYDDEQQALRAADRLLSRTLANACAEEDGGLSAELAPTQTHVLLRAPRCFVHPAWVPRQNLSCTLDGQLQAFLDDALRGPAAELPPPPPPRRRAGVKTEGVWVASAHGGRGAPAALASEAGMHEDDEMIWWAWDGKVVGFADW